MQLNFNAFKPYDIRGKIPEEVNEDLAYQIGRAYADVIKPTSVIVGHDIRLESPSLAKALMNGLTSQGIDVIDIGLCGTEEVYFQTFHRFSENVGGGIMVTASHNPKGYNGFKFVRENSIPLHSSNGLLQIKEKIAENLSLFENREQISQGKISKAFDKTDYITHLLQYIDVSLLKPLKIVMNPGNGAAGPVLKLLEKKLPFTFVYMNESPDGNFPNGVPNPLLPDNRTPTSDMIKKHKADFGLAWDGDFDRCFFYDEVGNFVEGYYIVGLLAESFLRKNPEAKIIHDPRLVWNTTDIVTRSGGKPIQCKTGHAFIKDKMRSEDAVYGGEMSAHHYFRNFGYCDSGMIPWLLVAEMLSQKEAGLSTLLNGRITAFPCSGEINYVVQDQERAREAVLTYFSEMQPKIDECDGISVAFSDWRFNMRSSNTEPLLRLNVESKGDLALLKRRTQEIENIIKRYAV